MTFGLARPLIIVLVLAASAASQSTRSHSTRLNKPLVGGQDLQRYEVSLDGQHAVYLADQEVDGLTNLYSVDLKRAQPIRRLESVSAGSS